MSEKEKSPGTVGAVVTGANTLTGHKDTKFPNNSVRQRLYELFLSGGKYSVVQLSVSFRIPDPRSHIRYIRNAGVSISDYWVNTGFSKHKIYFIAGLANKNKGDFSNEESQ